MDRSQISSKLLIHEALCLQYLSHEQGYIGDIKKLMDWLNCYDYIKPADRVEPPKPFLIACILLVFPYKDVSIDMIKLSCWDAWLNTENYERMYQWIMDSAPKNIR